MKKIIFLILISLFVSSVFAQDLMDVNEMIDPIEFNLKVKNTPNGKLQAKLTNLKDPTDTFSFYTNNITQIDLQNILLAFFEKTKNDTANEDEKNKINAHSFKLYAQLPTISDTREAQETAVKIQTKKRIPLELTNKNNYNKTSSLPKEKLENSLITLYNRIGNILRQNKGISDTLTTRNSAPKKNEEIDIKNVKFLRDGGRKSFLTGVNLNQIKVNENNGNGADTTIISKRDSIEFIRKVTKIYKNDTKETTNEKKLFEFTKSFQDIENFKKEDKENWETFLQIVPDSFYNLNENVWNQLRSDIINLNFKFYSPCVGCDKIYYEMKSVEGIVSLYKAAIGLDSIYISLQKYRCKSRFKYLADKKRYDLLYNTILHFADNYVQTSDRVLNVEQIDMTFKDGYIQDLRVSGDYNGLHYTFNNKTPIGYSSKSNFVSINNQKLFENRKDDGVEFKLDLGNLFVNHNPELSPKTKDYSPDEQKVSFEITQPNQWLDLKRDNTKEIIDMQIFTDLWGVGKKEPNGLVQIEVGRIFKLNTVRKQITRAGGSFGMFESIRISGLLSKIEQKERFLELSSHDSLVNGRVFGENYAPAIDFFRHQTFQVGVQLNLVTFDIPSMKSMLKFDIGSHYLGSFVRGNKAVLANGTLSERRDTINDFVGSALFQPEIRWDIAATERIGGFVGYRANLMWLLNNNYSFSEGNNFNSGKRFDYFHTILAEFFYRPVNKDKLFIRASINLQPSLLSKHFTQIQLGYILNIFQNTSAKK